MRHIQVRFEQLGSDLSRAAPGSPPRSLDEIARNVLPTDDSSLQWSPVGVGLTTDPSQKLEALYDRLVMRYDDGATTKSRRTDEDVWREFRRDLEQRRLLKFFEPKTISVKGDEVRFEHAWKNGQWHCLEPVSFDLASADSIKDKAHKLLGQMTSIADSPQAFRLYMLVAGPGDDTLQPTFESALSILEKMPCDKEIVREGDHASFADRLAVSIAGHVGQQRLP